MTSSQQSSVHSATDGIKDFSFLFAKSLVTEMIHCEVLDETINQSFNRWSRLDTIMQALIEVIVHDPDFIALVDANFKQSVITAIEKKLSRESPVTKKISSSRNRSDQLPLTSLQMRSPKPDACFADNMIKRIEETKTSRLSRTTSPKGIDVHHLHPPTRTVA